MENLTKLNRRRWAVQLALTTGLALLFITALLCGLLGVTPARADPGTLYVDGASGSDTADCSNPATPCATIGYALTQAGNGDEIRVAEGTYIETLDVAGNPITLRGGYTVSGTLWLPRSGETVVDADGADSPVFNIDPGNNVTVEGFTVQGANHVSDYGGGFFINGATVVISDTVIRDNSTDGSGGGIYVEEVDGAAKVSLINSELLNNEAGNDGGGLAGSALITLDYVKVVSNTAQGSGGGGLSVSEAILSVSNSSVMDNSAPNGQSGGIDVRSGSTVNVVDSIIADNSTRDHGGAATIDPGATLNLTNALITGNSTTSGNANALAMWDGQVTLINSTISDNNPQGAQAVIRWSGALTITNSIMWNNALNLQGDPPCPECFTVTYSDIEGGWTGTGNISADPLFVGGDYHLGVGSPCIDKGTSVGAPVTDIEGTPRDAAPDMGAYEWTGFRIFLPLTLRNFGP